MATATLQRPAKYTATPDGEFVVVHNVALFDEHLGPDGEHYDREALAGMVDTMNERIADTGDYCPIVLGHTPDDDEVAAGADEPDVVGFAGPFYLGIIGLKRPRWCIFATDWRIYRDRAAECERHPRRSVEVWKHPDLRKRYFDPIALCGAETPKRDLGLVRYRKNGDVERYEAAYAGATNTFIPTAERDKRPDKNFMESDAMPIDQESLNQIVQAITPVIEAKIAEAMPMGDSDAGADLAAGANPAGAATGADDPAAAVGGAPDHYAKLCKYAMDGDTDGGAKFMDDLDDAGKAGIKEKYEKEEDEDKKNSVSQFLDKYSKLPPAQNRAMWAQVPKGNREDKGKGAYKEGSMDDSWHETYAKHRAEVERYRKDRDDFREKYSKAVRERDELREKYAKAETELTTLRGDKIRVERYSKLKEFEQQGFVIDPDEEIVDVVEMSDKEWERHQKQIERYQRVPLGGFVPRGKTEAIPVKEFEAAASRSEKVKAHALKTGMSYEEADAALKGTAA